MRMLRRTVLKSPLALLGVSSLVAAQSCAPAAWPQWEHFAQRHVQADGRVVDFSLANQQTTSEGQSYAMFFALVANDCARFARLWRWSCDNLGAGSNRLPAWQWGRRDDGSYAVLDPNSASDADLWIAYCLLEAGRLWRVPGYEQDGMDLLVQIKAQEMADLPSLGPMLLPGAFGFAGTAQRWRLNPSYLPLPLLRKLARVDVAGPWQSLIATTLQMIRQSAPQGFAPDWVSFQAPQGFMPDRQTQGIGSYDAIRTYLWAGMTDDADALAVAWRSSLSGMARHLSANSQVPEKIDTLSGAVSGQGPVGFSAALLPYLHSLKLDAPLRNQTQLVQQQWSDNADQGYYNSVLMLFGWGWLQAHYRFDAAGDLHPAWSK